MSVAVTTAGGHVVVVQVFPKGEEPANLQPIDCKSECKTLAEPQDKAPMEGNAYLAGQQKSLGIIQIMSGLVTATLGVTLLICGFTLLMAPLWTGTVYILSGALSVFVAAQKGNRTSLLKGTLAMNIISALMAVTGTIVICYYLAVTVTLGHNEPSYSDYGSDGYSNMPWEYRNMKFRFQTTVHGIHGLLLVLAVLEFCVATAASVLALKAIRHPSGDTQQSEVTVPTTANVVSFGYSDLTSLLSDVPNCPPPAYDA